MSFPYNELKWLAKNKPTKTIEMKLKIEGKLRDGFFEWLQKIEEPIWQLDGEDSGGMYIYLYPSVVFDDLPQSAQFGLLQEYADTLGYMITIDCTTFRMHNNVELWIESGMVAEECNSRPEAQVAAIEKLNEILNQLKDK